MEGVGKIAGSLYSSTDTQHLTVISLSTDHRDYNTEHLTMITSSLNLHIISYTEEVLQTMYYTM